MTQMFGRTPDPDFQEASLLEQYQAQIGSALTPAFAADSSPDLASEAINVCGTFVAAGIVTNVDRMGRIFRLLVTGLEQFASGYFCILFSRRSLISFKKIPISRKLVT